MSELISLLSAAQRRSVTFKRRRKHSPIIVLVTPTEVREAVGLMRGKKVVCRSSYQSCWIAIKTIPMVCVPSVILQAKKKNLGVYTLQKSVYRSGHVPFYRPVIWSLFALWKVQPLHISSVYGAIFMSSKLQSACYCMYSCAKWV